MARSNVVETRRGRMLVLAVVALALIMVVSAVSGLNVALPELARATGATQGQLQWIVDAYSIVFAALLLPAGNLGDRIGRKRALLAGLTIFGIGAAAATTVSSPGALIAFRIVMGVGAALVMPSTLSVITTSFPADERGQAVGIWVGMAGAGGVIGIFASGLLLQWFSWSSFFVFDVVLAVIAGAGTFAFLPSSRDERAPRLDLVGSLSALAGVAGVIFGIIEGPSRGWGDGFVVAALAAGAGAIALFVRWELHRPEPMLDPRLFLLRGFGTGSASITVQFLVFFGFIFILMQYLQFVVGYSPLKAALAIFPFPLVMLPMSRQAPKFVARAGTKRVGIVGLLLLASSMITFSFLTVTMHYGTLAVGLVLLGAGLALSSSPATTDIVESLPDEKQGVASAVNDTSRELGTALGIAVLGSVVNNTYAHHLQSTLRGLPAAAAHASQSSIAVAQSVAAKLGPQGAHLKSAATHAFVNGLSAAAYGAAGLLVLGALFVALRAPRPDALDDGGRFGGHDGGQAKPSEPESSEPESSEPRPLAGVLR